MGRGSDRFRAELRVLLPRLRRFGHTLTGSVDDGDDLLQDALEKALAREDQYRHGSRLDSWVYRIMQTTWIDKKRAETRRNRVLEPLDDMTPAAGEDGRRSFDARVSLDRVREAMGRLHHDERAVLALVSIEGFTYQEAAEALKIPIGTVMSRVARARTNLLSLLENWPASTKGSGL